MAETPSAQIPVDPVPSAICNGRLRLGSSIAELRIALGMIGLAILMAYCTGFITPTSHDDV